MHFLIGLTETYDSIRSHILSMDPLPTVNRAFYFTQQLERQKEVTMAMHNIQDSSAFATNKQPYKSNPNSSNSQYPSNYNSSYSNSYQGRRDSKRAKFDRKCSHCHQKGHLVE